MDGISRHCAGRAPQIAAQAARRPSTGPRRQKDVARAGARIRRRQIVRKSSAASPIRERRISRRRNAGTSLATHPEGTVWPLTFLQPCETSLKSRGARLTRSGALICSKRRKRLKNQGFSALRPASRRPPPGWLVPRLGVCGPRWQRRRHTETASQASTRNAGVPELREQDSGCGLTDDFPIRRCPPSAACRAGWLARLEVRCVPTAA